MGQEILFPVASQPGIARDGSLLGKVGCIDGEWVRFYQRRPQKIKGMKLLHLYTDANPVVPRTLFTVNSQDGTLLYVGLEDRVEVVPISKVLTTGAISNITPNIVPASGATFSSNPDNLWMFDQIHSVETNDKSDPTNKTTQAFDYVLGACLPIARALDPIFPPYQNLNVGHLYYAPISAAGIQSLKNVKESTGGDNVSVTGGFFVLGSYIITFGTNGQISWNDGTYINNWPAYNTLSIGVDPFFYGAPVRGSGQLTGLVWSPSGVVMLTLGQSSTGLPEFDGSFISTISTCISSRCIVSYEPYFFWVGNNTFYQYNGAVTEVPNETNRLFFFNSLNRSQSQKITSFVNTEYQEWWILFPRITEDESDPQECNWALIYNIAYQCWYDTPLKRASAARSTTQLPYPIMGSSTIEGLDPSVSAGYALWIHEKGTDKDANIGFGKDLPVLPILSGFSEIFTLESLEKPQKNALTLRKISLDLEQVGEMSIEVGKKGYPRGSVVPSGVYAFYPETEFLTMEEQGTILIIKFSSFDVGGTYLMGKSLLTVTIEDETEETPGSQIVDYSNVPSILESIS